MDGVADNATIHS
ncbi:conserved hypothetical protein [Xenorhabdus bovienii str. Jollieti]|nr:conserved hypothetical protein [Xenorhabdus bovienii str. Jollieti]